MCNGLRARLQFAKSIYFWGGRWVVFVIWSMPYGLGGLYEPVPQRSSKNENRRHCTIAQSGNDLSVGALMRYSQYFLTSVGE
jgi:hypothetical protein